MTKIYVFHNKINDTYHELNSTVGLTKEELENNLITTDSIRNRPGDILKRDAEGNFFYEEYEVITVPEVIETDMESHLPTQEEIQAQILLNTELILIYKELEMEGI